MVRVSLKNLTGSKTRTSWKNPQMLCSKNQSEPADTWLVFVEGGATEGDYRLSDTNE